jgi:aldose 1-epimerase
MVKISQEPFGQLPGGEPVSLFTFSNGNGVSASVTNFGGRLVRLLAPDHAGLSEDVVLGFDNLDGYLAHNPYFGAIVGRYANRIANAKFSLDGKTYELARNNGSNSLHGGTKGFDKVLWDARELTDRLHPALELKYRSVDGEDGYPGNLDVTVVYSLDESNELRIEYKAQTDKPTVLNLTNHSYFDLAGQGKGTVLDHVVTLGSDAFTPVTKDLVPTGEIKPVSGTPFDFRTPRRLGDRIDDDDEQLKLALGYDHNFVIRRSNNDLVLAGRVVHPESGRVLEVLTTLPGVQFYTGNHLTGSAVGKDGVAYGFRTGFCLETQFFPDSPNHPEFPSVVLRPGELFDQTTVFRLSVSA